MRFANEETRLTGHQTGFQSSEASKPQAHPDSNTTPGRGPTQYERVLAALLTHGELCGHRVLYGELAIPRFGAHLHRMRKNGIVWSKRPCTLHEHEGTAYLYRIEYVIDRGPEEVCPACGGRLGHVSMCPARRDPNALPGMGA